MYLIYFQEDSSSLDEEEVEKIAETHADVSTSKAIGSAKDAGRVRYKSKNNASMIKFNAEGHSQPRSGKETRDPERMHESGSVSRRTPSHKSQGHNISPSHRSQGHNISPSHRSHNIQSQASGKRKRSNSGMSDISSGSLHADDNLSDVSSGDLGIDHLMSEVSSGSLNNDIASSDMSSDANSDMKTNVVKGSVMKLPMHKTHTYKLCCIDCIEPKLHHNPHVFYEIVDGIQHSCKKDFLLVCLDYLEKANRWTWIRDKPSGRYDNEHGQYRLCTNYTMKNSCLHAARCRHAHSEVERIAWNAYAKNMFSVAKFIKQNQSMIVSPPKTALKRDNVLPASRTRHTITSPRKMKVAASPSASHTPSSYIKFVCGKCWKKGIESEKLKSESIAGGWKATCDLQTGTPHLWFESCIVLLYPKGNKPVQINPLPVHAVESPNIFECKLCNHKEGCTDPTCFKAHSIEEAKVWKWQLKNKGKGSCMNIQGNISCE